VQAQDAGVTLKAYEDTLKKLAPKILKSNTENERIEANTKFLKVLLRTLKAEGSYKYPFDSLVTIARLSSDDNVFRIFNWNLPKQDGTFSHFGIIQTYDKSTRSYRLFELQDQSDNILRPEMKELNANNWFGAHYYSIIPNKKKKKRHYILLGWDGNNKITSKKIIDVLHFTKTGEPKFGKAIFEMESATKYRVVFEYTSKAVMMLRYYPGSKAIIYDHLGALNATLKDMPQFQGPDGSYDAFLSKKGKWKHVTDFDARNAIEINNKYNDPE